jgi:hypothetical protein
MSDFFLFVLFELIWGMIKSAVRSAWHHPWWALVLVSCFFFVILVVGNG